MAALVNAGVADAMGPGWHGQSLESYLILAIQRVPRYKLLLESLRQQTPEGGAPVTAPRRARAGA